MPSGDTHSCEHLVPSHVGLAYVLFVDTSNFPEFVVILPDNAIRTSLGTFLILLVTIAHVPLLVHKVSPKVLIGLVVVVIVYE